MNTADYLFGETETQFDGFDEEPTVITEIPELKMHADMKERLDQDIRLIPNFGPYKVVSAQSVDGCILFNIVKGTKILEGMRLWKAIVPATTLEKVLWGLEKGTYNRKENAVEHMVVDTKLRHVKGVSARPSLTLMFDDQYEA